jgi:hypothetical protein
VCVCVCALLTSEIWILSGTLDVAGPTRFAGQVNHGRPERAPRIAASSILRIERGMAANKQIDIRQTKKQAKQQPEWMKDRKKAGFQQRQSTADGSVSEKDDIRKTKTHNSAPSLAHIPLPNGPTVCVSVCVCVCVCVCSHNVTLRLLTQHSSVHEPRERCAVLCGT